MATDSSSILRTNTYKSREKFIRYMELALLCFTFLNNCLSLKAIPTRKEFEHHSRTLDTEIDPKTHDTLLDHT